MVKTVVSVSLGASSRNGVGEAEFLGQQVRLERIGTDGDLKKLVALMRELDGQVDAIGTGGIKLHVHAGNKAFPLKGSSQVAAAVSKTPLVDGSGLKDTIERRTFVIMEEQGIPVKGTKTLLMSAIDRFGMAESLWDLGADVLFGDFLYGLGVPFPIRRLSTIWFYGSLVGPLLRFIPFSWIYPTGKQQEENKPRFPQYFAWADMIAGDYHYIRRYMPEDLKGKTVVTNTVTAKDVEDLRRRGVKILVTGSPDIGGRTFATNVLEAALVAVADKKRALSHAEYEEMLDAMNYRPRIEYL